MIDKKFDDFDQYINTLPKEFEYTGFLLTQLFNEYKKELKYAEWFKKSNSDAVMKWWSEEEIARLLNSEIKIIEKVLKSNSLSKADKYVLQAVTKEKIAHLSGSMKYECQKYLNDSKEKKDNPEKAPFAIPKWCHHQECAYGYEKFISNVRMYMDIYEGESK